MDNQCVLELPKLERVEDSGPGRDRLPHCIHVARPGGFSQHVLEPKGLCSDFLPCIILVLYIYIYILYHIIILLHNSTHKLYNSGIKKLPDAYICKYIFICKRLKESVSIRRLQWP